MSDSTPFALAATDYLDAGWPGVIPMTGATEAVAKGTPLVGTTGHRGVNLTREQVAEFLADPELPWRYPNISLRADGWVGIDVDQYGDKTGAGVLAFLEEELGALPPTWISSARELPSGIRIFRLPDGVVLEKLAEMNLARFAAGFGYAEAHIDIIRRGHRYVKVWPTPHPSGAPYRWHAPSGAPVDFVPELDWCPELPKAWLDFLTQLGPNMDGVSLHGVSSGGLAARAGGTGDRVFTAAEAIDFMAPQLDMLRGARFNSGSFNATLTAAASTAGHFVEMFGAEAIIDVLADAITEGNGAAPDFADMATIRSGLRLAEDWQGRLPDEREQTNPFAAGGRYLTLETRPATAREMATQRDAIPHPRVSADNLNPGGTAPDAPDSDTFLSEAFWAARPVFGHLRRAAWARMQSPEGVLTAALAITAAHAMPNIVLPAVVGTVASLNLMTVICGDPGDGKSVCRKIATEVLDFGDSPEVYQFNPSSGQGVAGQYQRLQKERGKPPEMVRTKFRAMGVVEESDTIAALSANPNSTLSSELRKAAMGESLGFGNVGETQTNIPEHEYRFVMMMCMQPELGGWLLGDAAGGLPQRFLWCSVRDPRVVDGVEDPGVFPVSIPFEAKPDPVSGGPRSRRIMGVADEVAIEIKEAARQRKILGRQAGKDFDGHAILTRLKVAGALCVLDGRLDITETDWDLAGAILASSDASRAWVQAAVADRAARENELAAKARGRARLIEETVVSTVVDTKTRARVTTKTLAFLERNPDGMSKADIRRKLQAEERHLLDDGVLDALLDLGQVRFEVVKSGNTTGSRWFRVS